MQAVQGRIVLTVDAGPPYSEIVYTPPPTFEVYAAGTATDRQPVFLSENTTTLVEVVLNRKQTDKVLRIRATG